MNTPAKIDELFENSGLELSTAQEIKGSYLPFLEKIHQTIDEAQSINKDNPSKEDEELARRLRLELVPNRTSAHKFKMARTEKLRIVKNIEDASYKLIENESKLVENELKEIEDFQENKRKAEQEKLKIEREEIALKYIDNPEFFPLGAMNQEQFDKFIEDQKLAKEARERIEEEERKKEIAKAKAIELERVRKDKLLPYWSHFMILHPEADLGELNEEEFDAIYLKAKSKSEEEQKENKRLRDAAEKAEKEKIQFVKNLKKLLVSDGWIAKNPELYVKKGHEITTEKLSEHSQATLEAFMDLTNKKIEESNRITAFEEFLIEQNWEKDETGFSKEGHFIKNAELKEHSQTTLIAFMKLTDKEIEQQNLKKSPDKEQLKSWVDSLTIPEVNITSEKGTECYASIRVKFEGFKKWALNEIEGKL